MIKKVIFLKDNNIKYYPIHFQFVFDLFQSCGIEIELSSDLFALSLSWNIIVDGKEIIIDFSDSGDYICSTKHRGVDMPGFKMHYKKTQKNDKNIYPFSPVSFYTHDWINWKNYDIKYTCNSDIILNNQKAYAGALLRRLNIRNMLKDKYDDTVDITMTGQLKYWQKINNCLVAVFVPGQNNNILDRGMLQYMAFGCCTISPRLPEILPYYQELIPMEHYIMCEDNYSDLIEKIEWVRGHRKEAIEIGNNAKKLFQENLMPAKLIEWIERCIK